MSDDSDTDDELAQALEGVITAAAPALSEDELETLGEAVGRLREDSSDDVPEELTSLLNWAEITVAPDRTDGDYIAAWDDSKTLQSRNVIFNDERFEVRYITWGDENEYDDSHVEITIGDSETGD